MTDEKRLIDPRTLRAYAHPLRIRLMGLLRSEGPMTATQAAAALGDNVPNCSFHLRQLAKYGFAERVPGADGRERPWQATARTTSWDDDSDDRDMRAAADQLNTVLLDLFTERARDYLAIRGDEPSEWRAAAGFGDALVHLTAAELRELTDRMEALLEPYAERLSDPSTRPPGARPIELIQMAIPRGPVPEPAGSSKPKTEPEPKAAPAPGTTAEPGTAPEPRPATTPGQESQPGAVSES